MSEEENKGWKERHFFSLNLPKAMPDTPDNPSTLPDLATNPAAYPDEPEPVDLSKPLSERPTPDKPSTEPSGSVAK